MGTKQGVDFGYTDVKDITVLREIMEIRGRAMHMLKILDYETHTRLVNRYVSLLRVTPAEGFRRPTVNELRKTDRNLFEEILSWVAKGYGTLQAGITYHLDDRESWVWKLMHQQPESTPDQGVEKTLEDKSKKRRRDISSEDEDRRVSRDHKNDRRGGGRDDPPQPRYCLVCGKRHEPRCELTPGLRKELRAKSKAQKEKAKQFKKGKRCPLIPDGLQSPSKHMAHARVLKHPFTGSTNLKKDHLNNITFLERPGHEVVTWRLLQLQRLKAKVRTLAGKQTQTNKAAAWTAEKLGLKIQTETMSYLQDELNIEDKDVPDICLKGLGILGDASISPFFEPFEVRPTMSQEVFHHTKWQRSLDMMERVKTMGRASPKDMSEAIWRKTLKEVATGTMGPPMSLEEVRQTFMNDFQIVPSFGLRQGHDESGQPKFRRIDDYTASGANPSSHRWQKVPMTMPDYVGVLSKTMGRKGWDIRYSTDDMKSAYRQIPLDPKHVRYAITAVYDPTSDSAKLFTMYGQPFGAGHSVPNFCRVAEWLSRFCQRYFKLCADHFFDDFFTVEPSATIQSAMFCLQQSFSILGFSLDPEKTQPPSDVCNILGVVFNSSSLQLQRRLLVESKPTRIANLKTCINEVLSRNSLTPSVAASIVGKFQFLCSTMFGKVGRCCTAPIRHRQYSVGGPTECTSQIRTALRLMIHFLDFAPSRRLYLDVTSPVILYTDASDVPERTPRQVLGAVLIDQDTILHTYWPVSPAIISRWIQKKNHMSQLELLAAPLALATWRQRLERRDILLFIDNEGACANLVKGFSPQTDSSAIVGQFWLMACSLELNIYVDRVESKSNPSDGPSRLDCSFLTSIGSRWTNPQADPLENPQIDPAQWFERNQGHRGE